jgi:hypothetical protein
MEDSALKAGVGGLGVKVIEDRIGLSCSCGRPDTAFAVGQAGFKVIRVTYYDEPIKYP